MTEEKPQWEIEFEKWWQNSGRTEDWKPRYKAVWKDCYEIQMNKIKSITMSLANIIQILKNNVK